MIASSRRVATTLCVLSLVAVVVSAQTSAWSYLNGGGSPFDFSGFVTGATISGGFSILANSNAQITLFAPTNNAFGELAVVTGSLLTNLYTARFRRHLDCFIESHIVDGVFPSGSIAGPTQLTSRSGHGIAADTAGGLITVDGNQVQQTDIVVNNGIVHVIDTIPILPPCVGKTIAQQIQSDDAFSTLVARATAAQLLDYLHTENPITVFLPTNDAWDKLPATTKTFLASNPTILSQVLLFHVIPSVQFLDSAPPVRNIRTVQGESLTIVKNGASLGIVSENDVSSNSAIVSFGSIDNLAQNGIFHTINDVLFPPSFNIPAPIICFPGNMQVEVKGRGMVSMKHVKIGDVVKSSDDGSCYSKVYSFGHYQPEAMGEYLQLYYVTPKEATTKHSLQISRDHMVFVDNRRSVPASSLKVGDEILLETGRPARIVKIATVQSRGAYAPFTESGSIVVNGVVASNYIAMLDDDHVLLPFPCMSHHWLAHASQAPHRLYCRLFACQNETYTANGISTWVDAPYRAWRGVRQQGGVLVQLLLLLVLLPMFAVWRVIESMVLLLLLPSPISATIATVVVVVGTYSLRHCRLRRLQHRKRRCTASYTSQSRSDDA